MKKRIIMISALVLALVLALFALTACNTASSEIGEELVQNGSFSSYNETTNTLEGWTASSNNSKRHTMSDSEDTCLAIEHTASNYTTLRQTIAVDRNNVYKVSVRIRVISDRINGYGAYVSFLENTEYKFISHTTKTDDFVTAKFYVRPKNTDYLTLALCLGTEETGYTGTVYFDDVSVQRVNAEDVEEGYEIYDFKMAKAVMTSSTSSGIAFVVLLTLLSAVVVVAAYLLIRRLYARRDVFNNFGSSVAAYSANVAKANAAGKWYQHGLFIAAVIALGAFLIRLIPLLTMYGMGTTMDTVVNTAYNLGLKNGVATYFAKLAAGELVKNPSLATNALAPGQMYILAIIGAASTNAAGEINVVTASSLIRFINILADMAVVLMIYFYGKKYVGNKLSTVYASLYALLPVIFVISGVNGTFDSLLVALLLGAVILMVEKQYLPTYLLMTLAAILDLRALAIAPIIVAYFAYRYVKDDDSIRKFTANRAMMVFGLVGSFVLAYILTLPVGINQIAAGDAFYNFKVIVQQMTGTTYFVSNAFNLYGMVAMNGRAITQKGVTILNLLFLLVLEAYVISLYFKNRNKQELLLLVSFTLAVIAVFTLKVDYTYLFLSLAFAVMYTMISGDRRMYWIVGGYSVLGLLDIAQLLNQSKLVATHPTTAVINYETTNPFYIVFCVFTVLLTIYYVYVSYSITNNTKIVDIKAMPNPVLKTFKQTCKNIVEKFKKQGE